MHSFLDIFQGLKTLIDADPALLWTRLGLIALGLLLVYLGYRGTLEPLLMIPMGLSMAAVNAGVLVLPDGAPGTLFVDPLVTEPSQLITILQIDCFQPLYTFLFSNGLIACFVFMGIGVLLDVGYVLARPFESMFIAICAELGTVVTFPVAVACGLTYGEAASIAMVGGADGPMVLFTSLSLAKEIFVPITVVAYLYLGLTYGGYPWLIKLLVPKGVRAIKLPVAPVHHFTPGQKLLFAVVACTLFCLLFPVAAPLFLSLFLGVAVRESGLKQYADFLGGPLLYGSTFALGLLLGILCEARTLMNPRILLLLGLGVFALLVSGIGGLAGGWILYVIKKRKYNPVIGIAGVSCVPTTAKIAQKMVSEANPMSIILPQALGACISGVFTSAILCGIYVTVIPMLQKH